VEALSPERLFSLAGKVAFITGSAGGIGFGLARGFAAAGARVVLSDINPNVHESLRRLPGPAEHFALELDVTQPAAVDEAIATIVARCGKLDIAVNNAGIIVRKPFLEVEFEDWQRVIATNLTAYFTVAQRALRVMLPNKAGRIINVGSIMNHVSRPNLTPYVTAKGGVHAFTRAVAADLGGTGVTCNTLAPGYTATEFAMASDKTFHDFIADWTPAKRWGKPEDLVGAALLFASEAGAYINGQAIYVDGGFTAVTR
jgi:gluconate 5-dehydrogenase